MAEARSWEETPPHQQTRRRIRSQASLHGRGRLPVGEEIDIRLAHCLPDKTRRGARPHSPTCKNRGGLALKLEEPLAEAEGKQVVRSGMGAVSEAGKQQGMYRQQETAF